MSIRIFDQDIRVSREDIGGGIVLAILCATYLRLMMLLAQS